MLKKITKVYWFSNLICKIHINELIIKTREICNNITESLTILTWITNVTPEVTLVISLASYSCYFWSYICNSRLELYVILLYQIEKSEIYKIKRIGSTHVKVIKENEQNLAKIKKSLLMNKIILLLMHLLYLNWREATNLTK